MPVDMNKTIAEASLDNLHDIIIPEAIGFFPPAPGWVILGLLLLALLFHLLMRFYAQYKKSLYRREALEELGRYQGENQEENREEILQLLSLTKRIAIAAYGREASATLTGERWWNYMEHHSKVKITKELRDEISKLLYDEAYESNSAHYAAIKAFVTEWIKTHKVENHV